MQSYFILFVLVVTGKFLSKNMGFCSHGEKRIKKEKRGGTEQAGGKKR